MFELAHRMLPRRLRGQRLAHHAPATPGEARPDGLRVLRCRGEHVCDHDGNLDRRDIVNAIIDIPHRGTKSAGKSDRIEHRIGDERQRRAAERLLDQRRVDIGDPVAETIIGASTAVMHFVGMQDMTLAGQAMPPLAAIAENLHARQRDADRIGIVTMRRKGLTAEMRLHPFDPVARRAEPDASRRQAGRAAPLHDRSRPLSAGLR